MVSNMKKNNKAFTLIELLAVIIILGILLLIAIPSVTSYINNSRKEAYIAIAKRYAKGAIPLVNHGDIEILDPNTTYYIPNTCVEIEGESTSPYGKFKKAYILITYKDDSHDYYWISVDEAGVGVDTIINVSYLSIEHLNTDIDDIDTTVGVGTRTNIVIYNSNCSGVSETKEADSFIPEGGGTAELTMTYENLGGTGCSSQVGMYNKPIGSLCTPTREGYNFLGWYTNPDDGGHEIDENFLMNANSVAYAKWEKIPDVCKRATSLHSETCNWNTGKWCDISNNVRYNNTITYGSLGTSGSLAYGDAYDCDVNADGEYDPNTERFYVVSYNNEYVSLIYYNNTVEGSPIYSQYSKYANTNVNNKGPEAAYLHLPSKTVWKNIYLVLPGERDMVDYNNNLVNKFDYDDRAARLLTLNELKTVCNITSSTRSAGELNSCNYLFENTKYSSNSPYATKGIWLETVDKTTSNSVWAAGGDNRRRYNAQTGTTLAELGVRPVITISKNLIEY